MSPTGNESSGSAGAERRALLEELCGTPTRRSSDHSSCEAKESPSPQYHKGDRVEHSMWGQGIVLETRGAGKESRVKVSFPRVGIKLLIARFVRPLTDPGDAAAAPLRKETLQR